MYGRKQPPPTDTKPITQIMNLKSNEDLRNYLEERPELNLSLMKEKNQSTLLHFAAFKNELPKMKIYILHFEAFSKENHKRNRNEASFQSQLKAWINVQNSDGLTALHFATLHGNIEMIEFLERYGANMQVQSNQKENILFMCAENNHLKTAVYLLDHRDGKVQFNVNAPNHLGDTPLHKVAKHGFANFAAYLLAREDIERDARNNEGWTPLMYAVSGGHKEIVKRLLMKGANRHLCNQQEQRAIDLARALDKHEIVKILNDQYTNCDKIKIACNVKLTYEVEKPTRKYAILFLFLLHIVLIPSHLLTEVDLLNDGTPYLFYGVIGAYYLLLLLIYILLTRKHPRKTVRSLLQLELPLCPECCSSIRSNEFHCFTCGVCVSRYDHHCPWINNCVSSFNVGKFTLFLILLIFGCIEVMFLSISFYLDTFERVRPTTLFPIGQDKDKYALTNMLVCGGLAATFCVLLFSLLGDQLKNLFSNTTSYERAKNVRRKGSSLLTAHSEEGMMDAINSDNENKPEVSLEDDEDENEPTCFGHCCNMLGEKYNAE